MEQIFYATSEDNGKRIDSFLSQQGMTRNAAQNLLCAGRITINSKVLKKNYKLIGNETVVANLPEVQSIDILPQDLPLEILYEDEDIIVVNKQRGMVVHPAVGNWDGTLVNALMFHCGERLSGINGGIRPGIVHRIDKDTSGLLVVAKNDHAHQCLASQLEHHKMRREYKAIVCGTFKKWDDTIEQPIARHKVNRKCMAIDPNGRRAITHYSVITSKGSYSYVAFQLETGRTHQIRVHMAYLGHPIIGDPLYGQKKDRFQNIGGQCLHAHKLYLMHPTTGQNIEFTAPLPAYFQELLKKLSLFPCDENNN